MSNYTIRTNTGRQLSVEYNTAKIFLADNRSYDGQYTNSSYQDETLLAGMVLGKVTGTGKLKRSFQESSDGSQYPRGILMEDVIIPAGSTKNLTYCIAGDVADDQLIFNGAENLNTIPNGATSNFGDLLTSNTHIILVPTTDNTKSDNY